MDPPFSTQYKLGSVASNAACVAYRDLRILLANLPDKSHVERRTALLEYALQTRHLMVRLLGATRWAKELGPFSDIAARTDAQSGFRGKLFEDTADALWSLHHRAVDAPVLLSEIATAVDIVTVGAMKGLPRIFEASIGIESLPADAEPKVLPGEVGDALQREQHRLEILSAVRKEAMEQLGIATRNSVREVVQSVSGLSVFSWRTGPEDVCVRLGADGMWAANVSLDSLNSKTSLFRLHTLSIFVGSDPDAPGAEESKNIHHILEGSAHSVLSDTQESILRRIADERMAHAVAAAEAEASPRGEIERGEVMLSALSAMMTDDVCAPLIIDNLRAQAKVLARTSWKSALEVEGDNEYSGRPASVVIRYWRGSRNASTVRISQNLPFCDSGESSRASENVTASEEPALDKTTSPRKVELSKKPSEPQEKVDQNGPASRKGSALKRHCILITHEPPLPGCFKDNCLETMCSRSDRLNLEQVLEGFVRIRAADRLCNLADSILRQRHQLKLHPSCLTLRTSHKMNWERYGKLGIVLQSSKTGDEGLIVHLHKDQCSGLEIRVAFRTGGLRIRPFGAAGLAQPSQKSRESSLWSGIRHISSNSEEESIVTALVSSIRSSVKLDAAARAVCALDIGVSNTLPPGTASVAATASADRAASQLVPPFAPLERRSPRRFLTLSPPPPARDTLNGTSSLFVNSGGVNSRTGHSKDGSSSKRPRLTYATTSDALVFIQESSFLNEDNCLYEEDVSGKSIKKRRRSQSNAPRPLAVDTEDVDRYSGTAAAAAAWAVTRDVVERRLRRDSLLRAFVAANVASAAQTHHQKSADDGSLHLESASRVLLKVKCEPLPVRRAELLLRGSDAWQVRLSLLPAIFDGTDMLTSWAGSSPNGIVKSESGPASKTDGLNERYSSDGILWSVGVACVGSQLTFTYPSANAASVRSFFRDLTRARTAAALARGVPPSPFYRVLRRSPVRIVVGIGPFPTYPNAKDASAGTAVTANSHVPQSVTTPRGKPLYTAMVEYVYSKGNSGGFSLTFSPSKPTMEQLAPLIEEALDASGGQVGGILAGLLERACPVAAAAESAVRERGNGRIRFVTALRIRAVFRGAGVPQGAERASSGGQADRNQMAFGHIIHAVDVDARGGGGLVTVIDVGRATAVMIQQGFAARGGSSTGASGSSRRNDFIPLPKWDENVSALCQNGHAEAQRAGSTVVLRMGVLEQFLKALVSSARSG